MRDVELDNFKFVLISFVIIGHVIEPIIGQFEWIKSVYIFIYIFHMPMFAYVSGVFSSREISNNKILNILRNLVIPYILMEAIYSLFDFYTFSRKSLEITPLVPYWIMWYMFSLILWKFLLPVFNQFKYPVVIAVLAGLAVGTNTLNSNLSFSRTFVLLPFFLIGNYYHTALMANLRRFKKRKIVASAFIISVMFTLLVVPESNDVNLKWLYGRSSYVDLGVNWSHGFIVRFLIYALALLLGVAFLTLMHENRSVVTEYGENSLYIYIFHGFVMKGVIAVGLYSYIDEGYKAVILILLSLLLLPILSSRFSIIVADVILNRAGAPFKFNLYNFILANKAKE